MSLFTPQAIIIQGITGTHGQFHTRAMVEYGANIVAGTSPTKAGTSVDGIPVYDSIASIKQDISNIDATIIFVPAPHARGAIMEAIDAEIPLIICITEGIPVHDMLAVKKRLTQLKSRLLGPNCPGFITPGSVKAGIIPGAITMPGSVAVVSRSGTLTYEVAAGLSHHGIGQYAIVGIGGDPIKGLDFIDCLQEFETDSNVTEIILIGEIGGDSEHLAAEYIQQHVSKPVFAYIAGHAAPANVQLGHAGAILKSADEGAHAKSAALEKAGVQTFPSITELITAVANYKGETS